jgi:hypothetical protein
VKFLLSTCAAFALAGALYAPAASAQTNVVTPQQERTGVPAGPYLLSCAHPHMVNGSLVALCDDRATATRGAMDTWHRAELPNAQQCNGAVEDMNGRLTCGTQAMVGSSMAPQYYGSSFGNSGSPDVPPYAGYANTTPRHPVPGLPGFEPGSAPGYPQGQPVPPADKSYYSRPY